MRVIAGSARRINLVTPSGDRTRPTTDRIKETLFNILQTEVIQARFLDLFSGSGGIGIEAMSRGASECVFVENNREAVQCIKTNLKKTGFTDCSQVMAMDIMQAIRRLDSLNRPFDVIFLDPPYEKGFEERVIPALLESSLVKKDSLIILETSLENAPTMSGKYRDLLERYKEYKTNAHLFYRV